MLAVWLPSFVDPLALEAYLASRLVPLDKNPGVRLIGIGEVVRRIIGRSILIVISDDIQKAAGSLQLCGGQDFGIEAAIHAMHQVYAHEETEGVIMADAANAFNNLNRNVAIRNIHHQCPSLAAVVINSYRRPSNLYVAGECILIARVMHCPTLPRSLCDILPYDFVTTALVHTGCVYMRNFNPGRVQPGLKVCMIDKIGERLHEDS